MTKIVRPNIGHPLRADGPARVGYFLPMTDPNFLSNPSPCSFDIPKVPALAGARKEKTPTTTDLLGRGVVR
jgi:hypothetical protein